MTFFEELKEIALQSAAAAGSSLLQAYLGKVTGQPGAMPITLGNIGELVGVISSTVVLQHLGNAGVSSTPYLGMQGISSSSSATPTLKVVTK